MKKIRDLKNKIASRNLFLVAMCFFRRIISSLLKPENEVLIIRLDLIGDCTMFSGSTRAIISKYPESKISILCLKSTKEVFERIGGITKVYTYDSSPGDLNFASINNLSKSIGWKKFKILCQPQASRMKTADLISRYICAEKKIAIEIKSDNCGDKWSKKSSEFYDQIIPLPTGIVSEFYYYASFLSGIGISNNKKIEPYLFYSVQNEFKAKYFVVVPGASYFQKAWEPYKFAKVIDYLFHEKGWVPVILGTKREQLLGEQILASCSLPTSLTIQNLCGKTSVSEMIDIIGNAELVICNDSAAAHISSAVHTPCVAISGAGPLDRFLPYPASFTFSPKVIYKKLGCEYCVFALDNIKKNEECYTTSILKEKTFPCITVIDTKTVINTIDVLLKKNEH